MNIPGYLIDEVNTIIYQEFEDVYTTYIHSKRKLPFGEYLKKETEETWDELQNLNEITDETLFPIVKRRKTTKGRWVKKELEPVNDDGKKTGFNRLVHLVAKLFYNEFGKNEEACLASFQFKTFNEYKKSKEDELSTWESNDDILMCEYPYLEDKKFNQVETALLNDIRYILIKTVKKKLSEVDKYDIISLPNSMTNLPYDPTNRAPSRAKIVDNFYKEFMQLNDTTILESSLNVKAVSEGLMKKNIKSLNSLDRDILVYLMSKKDDEFYRTGTMTVKIGDIIRGINRTEGKLNYTAVKQSLIKMDNLETRVTDAEYRTVKVDIFYNIRIYSETEDASEVVFTSKENQLDIYSFDVKDNEEGSKKKKRKKKVEYAQIVFSNDLINEIVKNETTSMYKRIIESFHLNASKILIYPLQKERIACYSYTEEGGKLIFRTNINFFKRYVLTTSNVRSRQLKMINDSLDEIVSKEISLKSYKRTGDNYTLEFYPFTQQEMQDLLNNEAPKRLLESTT